MVVTMVKMLNLVVEEMALATVKEMPLAMTISQQRHARLLLQVWIPRT